MQLIDLTLNRNFGFPVHYSLSQIKELSFRDSDDILRRSIRHMVNNPLISWSITGGPP